MIEGLFVAASASAVAAFLALAELLHARFGTRAELLRKISHFGGGALVLSTPLYLPAGRLLVLCAVPFAIFYAFTVRRNLFDATNGLRQRSYGAAYFVLAVGLLAQLFWEQQEAFAAAMLVLTLGDGLAGVVGELAGRHRFTVWKNTRSVEGSFTMFVVSFVALAVLLAARGETGTGRVLLTAASVAAVATAVEAVSPGGSDNLLVPVVTGFAILHLARLMPLHDRLVGLCC